MRGWAYLRCTPRDRLLRKPGSGRLVMQMKSWTDPP